jgi:lysozyme family protein
MADFDKAIKVSLRFEGGYVNNPADPGGATNWGISTLIIKREGITAAELGIPDLTPESIKLMKVDAAIKIYKKLFWDKYKYSTINNQNVATKIQDIAINCGPSRAHMMAQAAVNKLGCGPLLTDGILGPKSMAAINKCDSKKLVQAIADEQANYYKNLVIRKPNLGVFLSNWLRRAKWIG